MPIEKGTTYLKAGRVFLEDYPASGLVYLHDTPVEKIWRDIKKLQDQGIPFNLIQAGGRTFLAPRNIELPEAHKRGDELRSRAVEIAQKAKALGAGIIIPFGLALIPTHLSTSDIRDGAGLPILNPAEIGIREAEIIMAAVK